MSKNFTLASSAVAMQLHTNSSDLHMNINIYVIMKEINAAARVHL